MSVCPSPPVVPPSAVSLGSLPFKGYYRGTDVINKGYLPNSSKFSLHLGSTCNVKISSPFFEKVMFNTVLAAKSNVLSQCRMAKSAVDKA